MKKFLFAAFFISMVFNSMAQSWIDITDAKVVNPRFENNDLYTGWSGTEFGAASPKENAEHYYKNFDSYQDIAGLVAGKYRLSLDAFYRMGNSSNDYSLYSSGNYSSYQYAQLYANTSVGDFYVPIVPASSAALSQSLGGAASAVGNSGGWGGWNQKYIPNNMEAAYYWFNAGYYDNTLEFQVGTDGAVKIGIRKSNTIDSDWCCLDNWKLEYYGTQTMATSVTLTPNTINIAPTEVVTITPNIKPDAATMFNNSIDWRSSNNAVATVDDNGNVTGVRGGNCIIYATTTDGSNLTASCNVNVEGDEPSADNIIINEIMAANIDYYLDPSKNYGSWVELYNPTDKAVIIGGLYISDDPTNLKKKQLLSNYGVIPAHGYAILNFDHHEVWTTYAYRQIDDKLDAEGGAIIISDGTNIIAEQAYPLAIPRTSYARTTDGGNTWGVTAIPSPGEANTLYGGFATQQLDAPVVDKDGQLFAGTLQVTVNIPTGATLKYTTDGSTPTDENGNVSQTGIFNVNNTTCYRFRLFKDGMLPSNVVTRSYILDNSYPFPIISIVTKNEHIYDNNIGVFKQGEYGRPGNGQSSKCNWNMDWDRPVSFEFITTDNECIVAQECDFAMCGGWSRAWTPHSFKIKAKKQYELKKYLPAQFFSEKPFLKHKTLQIRNGGNDTGCRIKDPALQQIIARSGMSINYQAWQPVHVFINGSHYAVLNMREPNNKDFAFSNFGFDDDDIDQFEMSPDSGYVQMRGTKERYERLLQLSENADEENTYQQIEKMLDIDEYVNYMALELYIGATDWPQNNVKGFRDPNDGKFRFVLFDLDGAFATTTPLSTFFGKEYKYFDRLYGYDYSRDVSIDGTSNYRQIEFVTLFKNLLNNDAFRKKFIDTYSIMGGSVFKSDHVTAIVNEMKSYLATGNYVDPSSTANSIISYFNSSKNYTLMNHLKSTSNMKLSATEMQSVTIASNNSNAHILLNDIQLPYNEFEGYLFAPITLKAQAPAGYVFAGWRGDATVSLTPTTIFTKGDSWNYYDQGSLDGTTWNNSVNSSWATGYAPLGYFTSDAANGRGYNTFLSYGSSTSNKYPTYYFTKSINLNQIPSGDAVVNLNFTCDDGFVVYVNGVEAGRYNMPSGSISYSTFASSYAPDNPDSGTIKIEQSLFKAGNNVIAVELHNNNASSTDIYWDAELIIYDGDSSSDYISTNEEFTLPTTGTVNITACFTPMDQAQLNESVFRPLKVNEVSAANSIFVNEYFKKNDWVEIYNPNNQQINIDGLYISDDVNQPLKYQITAKSAINTIVPPKGHIVVWTDNLEPTTQLHANFKLSNVNDQMVLIASSEEFVNNNTDFFNEYPQFVNFVDGLKYNAHAGEQSCGRFPDGATSLYKMTVPTINKKNTLQSYDIYYGEDEAIDILEEHEFELALAKGWNWTSHIISDPISVNEFDSNVKMILSQTHEAYFDDTYRMAGDLEELSAGEMYKIKAKNNVNYSFTGTYCLYDLPISLKEGWNWIGFTQNGMMTVANALSKLNAEEGDIIMGQEGFSTYSSGNWTGTLSTLEPGKGYMFKSANAKSLRFPETEVAVKMRRNHKMMGQDNYFGIDRHQYPNVMGIIAVVATQGKEYDQERFTIIASNEEGENVGFSKTVDGLLYITLYGNAGERVKLKAIDAFDGCEYSIAETFTFEQNVMGTTHTPAVLSLGETTDMATNIESVKSENFIHLTSGDFLGYYAIDGSYQGMYAAQLGKGMYVLKFNNGNNKKIFIR